MGRAFPFLKPAKPPQSMRRIKTIPSFPSLKATPHARGKTLRELKKLKAIAGLPGLVDGRLAKGRRRRQMLATRRRAKRFLNRFLLGIFLETPVSHNKKSHNAQALSTSNSIFIPTSCLILIHGLSSINNLKCS